jgi:DNA-binding response OmpR family regulator
MEKNLHILLCEDEESLGMLVREYLEAKGYNAELFLDGEAGYRAFMKKKYDMCLLDVMMPKMDGFALAKEIRLVNSEVPIIFLTAKNLKEDILEGFKLGDDDYLTKPFSMDELVYRMEAILRRVKTKDQKNVTRFQLGKFIFDSQRQVLIYEDSQTKLTTKESELLTMLCVHMNEVLERDLALKTIWMEDNYFNARSMDVYITKLRKLLKADPEIEINNVHGRGYRLIVPNVPQEEK